MRFARSFARGLMPALALSLMLNGCASWGSGRGHSKDAKPVAGAVDSSIKKRCRDPGVDSDPQVAIAENRHWATCETYRADAAVRTVEDLQAALTAPRKAK